MLPIDMKAFQFVLPEVIFGNGTISEIGRKVKAMGGSSVCILTDKGLKEAGVVGRVESMLKDEGVAYRTFDDVEAEPSLDNVLKAVEFAKEGAADVIIGLGGGSSMDVSKFAAIMLKYGGEIKDYLGIDNIPGRGLPTIMVPTTAGTGSEVSKYGIFDDRAAKTKLGAVSFHLVANLALIDPELTASMPPSITASTGCDALVHAVEGYLATNSNPLTDLLALESLRLIFQNLPAAFADGRDPLARYNMAYGSFLAGIVLNQAGASSSHALSYPIASEYHVVHGVGCMLTFFEVLEYFAPCSIEKFVKMAEVMGVDPSAGSPRDIAEKAILEMRKMVAYLEIATKLSVYGIEKDRFEGYAKSVVANQQRLITNGPRQLNVKDVMTIYERSY
jgi:alcohol dehydrogenase class IV